MGWSQSSNLIMTDLLNNGDMSRCWRWRW